MNHLLEIYRSAGYPDKTAQVSNALLEALETDLSNPERSRLERWAALPRRAPLPVPPDLSRATSAALDAVNAVLVSVDRAPWPPVEHDAQSIESFTGDAASLLELGSFEPLRLPWREPPLGWGFTPGQRSHRRKDHRGTFNVNGLPAKEKRALGPSVSARAYRRAVRSVAHLRRRLDVLKLELDRSECRTFLTRRFLPSMPFEMFEKHPDALIFAGYYLSLLSLHPRLGKHPAKIKDPLARRLLLKAQSAPFLIAHVYASSKILSGLTNEERAHLQDRLRVPLAAAARILEGLFEPSMLTSMTLRKGQDSSSWNLAAKTFNLASMMFIEIERSDGRLSLFSPVPLLLAPPARPKDLYPLTLARRRNELLDWSENPRPWRHFMDSGYLDDVSSSKSKLVLPVRAGGPPIPSRPDPV